MKRLSHLILVFIVGPSLILSISCKKEKTVCVCNDEGGSQIADCDGNIYHSVTIGTQEWLIENLRTTKYNDGCPILNITDNTEWANLTTPAFCWYNNDVINKNIYGALYNLYAVNTDKICPVGWHVPSDAEWHILILFLDPDGSQGDPYVESFNAANKLKETGTTHWTSPNWGASDDHGFKALPGGWRDGIYGEFISISTHGLWRTTSNNHRMMSFESSSVWKGTWEEDSQFGFSVRCIKD